ncbi:hypothetical protein Gotur_011823 [Gossypium turneri]
MEESGGDDREGRDEISLLAEELVQLSVKGSMVVPSSKPTLICTVWTEKLYNPDNFRAHMRGIWKTRKKFEIQLAVERDQIRLISSPFWIKIDFCFPEFDKKDLLHAIGATFGGVLRSEINEEFCRLKIILDVQRPL